MLRKISIILSVFMAMVISVSGNASSNVGYCNTTQNVYIEGITENAGTKVTLMAQSKQDGKIAYINEFVSDTACKYSAKFKFPNNINDYNFRIREGSADVTDNITVLKSEITASFNVSITNDRYHSSLNSGDISKAVVKVKNQYGDGGQYNVIVAFYDDNDIMIGANLMNGNYSFDDINTTYEYDTGIVVPDNAKYAKGFIFADIDSVNPLSKNYQKNIGDTAFGSDNTDVKIAFIGDSITHNAYHLSVIEHYYQTRYPKRNIEIVNKGIGGDTINGVYNRLDYDIFHDKFSGDIDECVLMIGTNDASRTFNPDDVNDVNALERTLTKYEDIIKKIIECKKGLTLMTSCVQDSTDFEGATTDSYPQKNIAIGKIAEGVQALAQKYNLPCIDEWTTTTEFTNERRGLGDTQPIITGTDRTHPGDNGGFYMAYQFIKQQGTSDVVANVAIDVDTGKVTSENADVVLKECEPDSLRYTYIPYSIPMAYTDAYKNAEENWRLNISDEINREIIKITNLDAGTYNVSMDDISMGEYTSAQLAEGVNIAVNKNNPGQVQAMQAYELCNKKTRAESQYRTIALTEQQMQIHHIYTYNELKDKVPDLIGYFNRYFQLIDTDYEKYGYKETQSASWNEIKNFETQAKEAAIPKTHTVTIIKK
ncbi:GDSL-type esterase/lipase family protein [Ructibacterium gallinarum]|uniref:SGNH hydrolase-type esterase domain-containing protein n=1 Tax=Ructibacterium gallinarum TaxID=2779355 RepID=A0A9D5R9B4_9FIRM|nr:GDSL-type esterase/lipase family protein [Ructibacterium gallinarum]MBE5040900.1 hypothetical protein [Ructibacterium gallinarum]